MFKWKIGEDITSQKKKKNGENITCSKVKYKAFNNFKLI